MRHRKARETSNELRIPDDGDALSSTVTHPANETPGEAARGTPDLEVA